MITVWSVKYLQRPPPFKRNLDSCCFYHSEAYKSIVTSFTKTRISPEISEKETCLMYGKKTRYRGIYWHNRMNFHLIFWF